jgi:hypothetical protein
MYIYYRGLGYFFADWTGLEPPRLSRGVTGRHSTLKDY